MNLKIRIDQERALVISLLKNKLLLTFRYLRDYQTFIVITNELFGISEGYEQKIFTKVTGSLVKILKLPNLKDLKQKGVLILKL